MHTDLPEALFDLTSWDTLSAQECEDLARFVETRLPSSFRLSHLATYEVGTQRRTIAHFVWQPSSRLTPALFSLIPGATTTLGFDRAHPLAVDEDLVFDWQRCCLECGDDLVDASTILMLKKDPTLPHYEAFYEYLAHLLHPLRSVTLQPLLVEVFAEEAAKVMPRPVLTYFRYYNKRLKREVTHINRQGHCSIPHRHVTAFLKQEGFRLLTADEWEYVCAAGSRTLFYWVNEQFEWSGDATSWEDVRNAFGLAIARDTIALDGSDEWEYCADPTIMKGDGGRLIGYDTAYLSLASAYRFPLNEKQINQGVTGPYFRRAYDLKRALEGGVE